MRSIQPPPSPFPARDHAQLVRGEGVYKNACGGCHDGTSPSKKPPAAAELGTDEQRLKNFAQEVDGERVIEVLSHLLGAVENAVKPKNPDSATQWNNTGRYGLRMLHGVWATAPYLHNNSVPTLADLLTAPEQRPKKFVIDYSRYDVERVGFMTLPQPTTTAPEFDTSALGNGNQGHTYGVDLSPEDKRALLTYLRQL
jgi:cytochrome c5